MKAFTITLTMAALVFAAVYLTVPTATDAPATFTVQYGPQLPWIEVYVDGVLTSEWEPRDGETYYLLRAIIERQADESLMMARGITP